jgi:hypothetical protein
VTAIRVDITRLRLARDGAHEVVGKLRTNAGNCTQTDAGTGVEVPALLVTAEHEDAGSTIRFTSADDASTPLLDARLGVGGRLTLTLEPEGARVFGAGAPSAPITLEMTL